MRFRQVLPMFLACIMLTGTAFGAEGETSCPKLTYEEYPEVDGSLACVPLMESLIMKVTGCTQMEASDSLEHFSNTNPSYGRLKEGEADLILSYEASVETKETLNNLEGLDLAPVGRDALVFIVNAGNPVDNLSKEQIHDIYTGKITNWSEVGGEDLPIQAFQRRENSGSQTLMRLLLMGDEEMSEEKSVVISGMEGLISAILEYDNSANAIGFSVYYYASVMNGHDNLKFLKVDGVEPTNETIRSGEYTLSNPFYCGVSSASSKEAVAIRDWLISPSGQDFVEECGYVGAGE